MHMWDSHLDYVADRVTRNKYLGVITHKNVLATICKELVRGLQLIWIQLLSQYLQIFKEVSKGRKWSTTSHTAGKRSYHLLRVQRGDVRLFPFTSIRIF